MRYRLVTNERQGAPKGTQGAKGDAGRQRGRRAPKGTQGAKGDGFLWRPLGMGPKWDQTNPSPLVPTRP